MEVRPLSLRKEKLSVSSCSYFPETLRPRMFRRASSLVGRVLDGTCICQSRAVDSCVQPVVRKELWRWIFAGFPYQLLSEGSRNRTPDYSESLTSQEWQTHGMLGGGLGDCGSLALVWAELSIYKINQKWISMSLNARPSCTMKSEPPTLPDSIALNRASGLAMAMNTPKGQWKHLCDRRFKADVESRQSRCRRTRHSSQKYCRDKSRLDYAIAWSQCSRVNSSKSLYVVCAFVTLWWYHGS